MSSSSIVTINSLKFDNSIRKSWQAELIERSGNNLVFKGIFETPVDHPDLGHIAAGTVSIEYYWLDGWYSIFRFLGADGELRNYYCNVNMPPVFTGSTLEYVDLDIDVVVWPNGRYSILDMAEFEENAHTFSYPDEVRKRALQSLDELVSMIESGGLPN